MADVDPSLHEHTFVVHRNPDGGGVGIFMSDTHEEGGLGFVTGIAPESKADEAGLKVGNRIIKVNGTVITSKKHIVELMKAAPEKPLTLCVLSADKPIQFFRCIVQAVAATKEENFDVSKEPWLGGHLFRQEDIMMALQHGQNDRSVKRIRTRFGWVSATTESGVEVLQAMTDEEEALKIMKAQKAQSAPFMSMLDSAYNKSVEKAELLRKKAVELDAKHGVSTRISDTASAAKGNAAANPNLDAAKKSASEFDEKYQVSATYSKGATYTKAAAKSLFSSVSTKLAPLAKTMKGKFDENATFLQNTARSYFSFRSTRPIEFAPGTSGEFIALNIYF